MNRLLGGVVALSLLLVLTGPAKAQHEFTILDVPGACKTFAHGINNSGLIVGQHFYDGDFGPHS